MAPEDQSTAFSGYEKLTNLASHQVSVFAEFIISLGQQNISNTNINSLKLHRRKDQEKQWLKFI